MSFGQIFRKIYGGVNLPRAPQRTYISDVPQDRVKIDFVLDSHVKRYPINHLHSPLTQADGSTVFPFPCWEFYVQHAAPSLIQSHLYPRYCTFCSVRFSGNIPDDHFDAAGTFWTPKSANCSDGRFNRSKMAWAVWATIFIISTSRLSPCPIDCTTK